MMYHEVFQESSKTQVCKYWKPGNVRIALYGLENQTRVENFMPFQIIGYDGSFNG